MIWKQYNVYFGQIMPDNPYFYSNDYSISILPTYKDNDVEKARRVFYGLGFVFLNILIFQALLQKMETDLKKLFYHALLYDRLSYYSYQ